MVYMLQAHGLVLPTPMCSPLLLFLLLIINQQHCLSSALEKTQRDTIQGCCSCNSQIFAQLVSFQHLGLNLNVTFNTLARIVTLLSLKSVFHYLVLLYFSYVLLSRGWEEMYLHVHCLPTFPCRMIATTYWLYMEPVEELASLTQHNCWNKRIMSK